MKHVWHITLATEDDVPWTRDQEFDDLVELDAFLAELPPASWPVKVAQLCEGRDPTANAVRVVVKEALLEAAARDDSPLRHPQMAQLLASADDLDDLLWDFGTDFVRRVKWPTRFDVLEGEVSSTYEVESLVVFRRLFMGPTSLGFDACR